MAKRTLENIIDKFTYHELKDMCHCINFFGDGRGSLYASPSNVRFYIKEHVERCVRNALESGELMPESNKYINHLKNKLESL